ncbi:Zinc finger MYND domain-containing protein 15 [Hypsizygus marmoreus]|uniref:Zinc finger MYND domain-containing protein 15 n=1 Tax=Hypsizygus marmoreus TaxID=39966 RepID=A0A369JMD0_HYPMA|nr:Zinc finger MYND domain-containing protein 15 [Hypsizygus marmoreus]
MTTSMHSATHVRFIAHMVQMHRRGEDVDDILSPICSGCGALENPGSKLLRCSGCKAVRYCNLVCAKQDWRGGHNAEGQMTEPHRNNCQTIKACTLKTPEMQKIAKQFPWARQQSDGTFAFNVLRASKDLLGSGREFGWWTEAPCCNTVTKATYTWGFLLLEDEHLKAHAGWKLPIKHIPWLDFDLGGSSPPKTMTSFEHSWTSYYEWRGLPMESPAVLLLHWPLTMYKLLHLLGFAPAQPPSDRRHLTIHLLGVERELDFLPVFGELALLFPNTDLDIVFFGPGVGHLMEKARKKPACLASQPFAYTYTAPKICGGGTVRIALSPQSKSMWDVAHINCIRSGKKPDAMIAFNAGLSSYFEWKAAVVASRALAIPFAVTDYLEVSLHSDVLLVMRILPVLLRISQVDVSALERQRVMEAADASYAIAMNPFMCPGPRPQVVNGGPSALNGYTMIVTPAASESL